MIKFTYDDGGRKAAGYKGHAGDCVVRSIAIATRVPYQEVYDALNVLAKRERPGRRRSRSSSRTGVHRRTSDKFMEALGWTWTPTMGVGTGCRVHLTAEELPMGRLVLSLSKHYAAVIDRVLYDTSDCSRLGTRCVYGYWKEPTR